MHQIHAFTSAARIPDKTIIYRNVSIDVIYAGAEKGYWLAGLHHSTEEAAKIAIDLIWESKKRA